MLDLPADDWQAETKQNGVRIVYADGKPWTRHGSVLSRPKGGECIWSLLEQMPKPLPVVEGEWVLKDKTLWLFDLPQHGGTYDQRRAALAALVEEWMHPRIVLMPAAEGSFRRFYEAWRGKAEGVVMKRRLSLYPACARPNTVTRDWIKRRYIWTA
jgi:hypothetical protein